MKRTAQYVWSARLLSVFLFLSVCAVPLYSKAALTESQIQSVLNLLRAFNVESATVTTVNNILHNTPTSPSNVENISINLSRDIYFGFTGPDVSSLQSFLKTKGYFSGEPSGYFGSLTKAAVMEFQKANGIQPLGGVGPITREKILTVANTAPRLVPASVPDSVPTPLSSVPLSFVRPLSIGSRGSDVSELQKFLISSGLLASEANTGYFGPLTSKAVAAFQKGNGLEAVGNVGPLTLKKLNERGLPSISSVSTGRVTPEPKVSISSLTIGKDSPFISGGGGGGGGGGIVSTPSSGGSSGGGGGGGGTTNSYGNNPGVSNLFGSVFMLLTGESPSNASQINTTSNTTITVQGSGGNHSIVLPSGVLIKKNIGGGFDVSKLAATAVDPESITPPSDEVAISVLQWGIPGNKLSFSQPITLRIAVDPNFNGDTLSVYHGESLTGPWTQDTGGTTCTITDGTCVITTSSASYFAVVGRRPTVTISASPSSVTAGASTTVTWSSTQARSCTASNSWGSEKATSGTQTFSNLTTNQTYTLTCYGRRGSSATQSTTVTVIGTPADTTPPSIPQGISALAVSTSQINLTWTASTDNVGVVGYRVFRGSTQIGTSTGITYQDTGLTASTQYSYTVRAVDAAGNLSNPSTSASATTQTPPPTDSVPPIVTITGPVSSLPAGTTQATLTATTNEAASCRHSTNSGDGFAAMTTFSSTGATSHSTTLTGLTNGTTYTYYVKCRDIAGNTSNNASVTFTVAAIVNPTWSNTSFASQTGTFTAEFDAKPNQNNGDITIGLSSGAVDAYSDLGAIIRFNSGGTIDARDGGVYAFGATIPYAANQQYHVRMVVSVLSRTYSVYITPQGQNEILLASNFAFRTEQAGVTSLNNVGKLGNPGDAPITNFSVSAIPIPIVPTVSISASPTSLTSGQSSTLTWSSTNATSCTASGGWSGSKAVSGTQSTGALTANTTYTLTCTGTGGSANQSVTVAVTTASDTTPPSTPTNLSGSAPSTSQINLTWSASTDNVGVVSYRVFRNSTQVGTPTGTSYSDTGLTANTTYAYTVRAVDAAGNLSPLTSAVNVVTQAVTPPPSGGNIAPSGTAYRWYANTSVTSNANKVAAPGLNDGNTTTDVRLSGGTVEHSTVYNAAGVIWSASQSVSSFSFINGNWDSAGDGGFSANLQLQFTTDGTSWSNSGWSVSPSYPYDSPAVTGQTYTFTGSATSILGARVVGQVHTTNASSYWVNIREVQALSTAGTSFAPRPLSNSAPVNTLVAGVGLAGNKVKIGDIITTTANLNIRTTPNGTIIATESQGSRGKIIGGPENIGTNTWWRIRYDDGKEGWSIERYLAKVQ